MGPKWFNILSNYLLISLICWFGIVRKMWGILTTSHAPINAKYNLSNKPYSCLSLLANLEDLLRPVDSRSIILGIFDPLSPSWHDIPLVTLDDCWSKLTLFKFDVFQTPSEYGCLITLETCAPSLTGPSFLCGIDCDGVSVLLLLYGAMISSWLRVSLKSYSQYVVNQVSLRSIFSGAPLCELCCTISVQFGDIVSSLINGTVENSSSNTTWNLGETWPVAIFITRATYTAWNGDFPR